MSVILTATISSTCNGGVIGSIPMVGFLGFAQQNKMVKQKFCKNLSEWVQIPNNESCFVIIAWYPSG